MKLRLYMAFIGAISFCQLTLAEALDTNVQSKRIKEVSNFLSRLQRVADSGKLDDVVAVSKLLDLSFTTSVTEREPQPTDCNGERRIKSFEMTRHQQTGETWYQATTVGVAKLLVPGFTINPSFVIDESVKPSLTFETQRMEYCSEPDTRLRVESNSSLIFSALPRYACILDSDIKSMIPRIQFSLGSDGYSFYRYASNDTKGAVLTFSFRAFAGCALSAEIRQGTSSSIRYQTVNAEFNKCRTKALFKYRDTHPKVELKDPHWNPKYGEDVQASEKFMRAECRTLEDRFNRDSLLQE